MTGLISDELNIKEIVMVEDETDLSDVSYKPNFRVLGPRFGKRMKEVAARVRNLNDDDVATLKNGGSIEAAGGRITLEDLEIQRKEKDGLVVAIDNNLGVGLDVLLDDELIDECTARELVSRIQNMRKEAGFDVSDRIAVGIRGDAKLEAAAEAHREYVAGETLAEAVVIGEIPEDCGVRQESTINGFQGTLALRKIG